MKKRIGNDIQFTWHIYRKDGDTQVPESFDGKEVEVKLISPLKQPVTIEDVTIATGVVTFTFRGKHQVTLGNYVAVLLENRGEDGMVTLDVVNAVTLVAHSYMEEDGDDGDVIEAEAVELESSISAGGGGGFVQQQADWAQTDASAVDFIKNKPDLDEYAMLNNPNRFTRTQVIEDERYRATFTQQYIELRDKAIPSNPALRIAINGIYKIPNAGTINSVVWEDTATSQIPAATTENNGLMSAADKGKLDALPTDTELTEELAGKQDTINDLAAIRSGAQAGATAYQKPSTGIPVTDLASDVQTNLAAIDGIEAVIPEQASANNKLADKDFVNSSVATATATYRGSYNLVADLSLTISATHAQIATALATAIQTADNNDYCFVQIPVEDDTPTEIARVERYKFNGTLWEYEYTLNNSGFTAAQWAAINSGITSGLVAKLSALPTNSELTTLLNGKAGKNDANLFTQKNTFPDIALSEEYALDYSECNIGDTLTTAYGEVLTFKNNNTNNSVQLYNNVNNFAINFANIEGVSNCIEIEVPSAGELRFTSDSTAKILEWMGTADKTSVFVIENNGEIIFYQDCRPSAAASDAAIGKIISLMKRSIPVNVQAGTVKIYFSALYERVAALGYLWYISNISFSSTISSVKQAVNAKADTASLAPVATSGSYDDLSDKPDLSGFITNSVDNLVNYYLKSETYTRTEVQQLIGALQMFHYEIYAELPQSGAGNVLYLIGPTDSGSDKYEEYVYANDTFTKIGDTSIDLSGYVTTSALNIMLRDYVTSSTLTVLLAGKADTSEMSVVPGTGANADKTTITLKQGTSATVLTAHQDISSKEDVTTIVTPVNATDATLPITTITCEVGKYYRIDVAVDTLAIALPAINSTVVKTIVIYLTGGTTPAITISSSDSKDIYYQDGFEIEAGNVYEINALFNGAAWIVASVKINVE